MEISVELVRQLVEEQFPQWAGLEIRPVAKSGHDNRTFHLGREMTARLPSGPDYVPQIEKEARWLPVLAEGLSLPIPAPLAVGKPGAEYPYPWAVNRFVEGEPLDLVQVPDKGRIAAELAGFLRELQGIPAEGGPAAGAHNFFRGASPAVYSRQTEAALLEWEDREQAEWFGTIWDRAVASRWRGPDV